MNDCDPFARWFSVLESFGEHMTFRLGHCRDLRSEPEWFFLPHQRYDGLGGVAYVLRERFGTELDPPRARLPQLGCFGRAWRALRCLLRTQATPSRFRNLDHAWQSPGPAGAAPRALAWALLSAERTERIRATARARGISLNSWLLWGLGQALASALVPDHGQFAWVVPVNLRGLVSSRADTDNHASTLEFTFAHEATPLDVDAALRRELESQAYWGTWQLMQWLRCCSTSFLRGIAQREMAVRKHGSFSNLGALSPPNDSGDGNEWWLAFNPVLCSRPIGAACLTWRGNMSLTLQIHPALDQDPRQARQWLNAWVAQILEQPASDLARCPGPAQPVLQPPNSRRAMSAAGSSRLSPGRGGTSET